MEEKKAKALQENGENTGAEVCPLLGEKPQDVCLARVGGLRHEQ